MDEDIGHDIKPISDYAEEVAKRIFCPDEERGTHTPFTSMNGRFAFRQSELTIWTGYKGHGKSSFISQMFLHFMDKEQNAFIISPEFSPEVVIEKLVYQHYMTRNIDEHELMRFFQNYGKKMMVYGKQTSLKPHDVIALCRYACDKFSPSHILIDSLMKCGIAPDDYSKQKYFVDQIQNIAHVHGPHIHLVAHARKDKDDDTRPPKIHDVKGSSEIADMAENVLVVWRNKQKEKEVPHGKMTLQDQPDAFFIVEAQRNADGWIGTIPLWYSPSSMLFSDTKLVTF
jgi:twinkle protein